MVPLVYDPTFPPLPRPRTQAISATQATISELQAQLEAAAAEATASGSQDELLGSPAFQAQLSAARGAAGDAVSAALRQHLRPLAKGLHAVLGQLLESLPAELGSVESFEDVVMPGVSSQLAESIVEATLMRQLWSE